MFLAENTLHDNLHCAAQLCLTTCSACDPQCARFYLHDMAAEAVLHDSLEARSGDALQQAVIALLCISLGSQHSRYQCLQSLPAHNKQLHAISL